MKNIFINEIQKSISINQNIIVIITYINNNKYYSNFVNVINNLFKTVRVMIKMLFLFECIFAYSQKKNNDIGINIRIKIKRPDIRTYI